ncbi:hypothetical protein DPMN_041732 [Dreissena polymorpha]|uniref:Uncharacterized protein n=1 Tax=Dreissena polymorpha TaxID=45954 RepID=A0A9D4CXH5_DREPO|nr:hypothetical protein DPMN_041732 [Dreissena polymorpha]
MQLVVRIITCLQGQVAWKAKPVEYHFVNKGDPLLLSLKNSIVLPPHHRCCSCKQQ